MPNNKDTVIPFSKNKHKKKVDIEKGDLSSISLIKERHTSFFQNLFRAPRKSSLQKATAEQDIIQYTIQKRCELCLSAVYFTFFFEILSLKFDPYL